MYRVILIWLFLVGNIGCAAANPDDRDFYRGELQKIDSADGINKEEAAIIAQNYLIKKKLENDVNILNPKVTDSKLFDICWLVKFNTTFRIKLKHGFDRYEIHVDKITGEIKSIGGEPSF